VIEARGPLARGLGLIGLVAWPPGQALLIPGCRSIHTFGVRFAIDLLWVAADGRVVRIDYGVRPRRTRSCRAAHSVIETAAGAGDAFLAAGAGAAAVT
jgi:uncharacterized protein